MRRSMLFLPGNTPNVIQNGDVLGADAVIFDLEDAVAPDQKDAARILVRNTMTYLDFSKVETIVRINSVDTDFWKKDLETILPLKPTLIMPPKTSTAQDVLTVDAYMSELEDKLGMERNTVKLIPLIETALGLENAFQIAAASKRVAALFLGAEDLTADLRCKRTKESEEIAYARGRMVAAARAAGVDVYDTPFTDVNDDEGIRMDTEKAKALGFTGKACLTAFHSSSSSSSTSLFVSTSGIRSRASTRCSAPLSVTLITPTKLWRPSASPRSRAAAPSRSGAR